MSEQKMPALPEFTIFGRYVVERIQREAYEAGRKHERERLEPLRVAVEALELELTDDRTTKAAEVYATARVIEAARTLFEDNR